MTAGPCVSLAKVELIIHDERNHPPRRSEAQPQWAVARRLVGQVSQCAASSHQPVLVGTEDTSDRSCRAACPHRSREREYSISSQHIWSPARRVERRGTPANV